MTQFHRRAIRVGVAQDIDERFMRAALHEAKKGVGRTSPNPAVGAVLVDRGKIVARGHHRGAGHAHAEVDCIAGVSARVLARSTIYITLEPCSTAGRTGACTEKIIEAGIKTVVVGVIDPNPRHNGSGIALLQDAGIEVRVGVLVDECTELNESFSKWIVTARPFVIAKCGMSLDGRLTRPPGEARWITSVAARRHASALRAQVDAVLVGAETIRADNPRLTVRDGGGTRQPWRVLLTRSGQLPKNARVFSDRFHERTLVYRKKSLEEVLVDLGRKEITSVLIEGGGDILGQALDARLIDKVQIYLGPMFTGGSVISFAGIGAADTQNARHLERVTYTKIDNDICVSGYPKIRGPD